MKNAITYVGLDAHKKDIYVAMLIGHERVPVTWQLPNEPQAIRRLVRRLEREAAGLIQCCYEAGPCGYALQRQLTTERVRCQVVAPALIPRKPGDHIKTNRRDARKLAELLRAEARLRRWIWRVPLPIGMLAAGAIFGTWAFPAGWSRVVLLRRDAAGVVVVADAVRVRQQ